MPDLPPKRVPPPPPGGLKPPVPGMKAPGLPGVKPPSPMGGAPSFPGAPKPPAPGMRAPGMSAPGGLGGSASGALDERLRKMEEHSREIEESKKKLEKSLAEMEIKLKDEKEKALSQAIKAREEEALSLKMEQALKEMQEKARTARREQEMEEARARAEEKSKDLERRLNEEREAWVINLKKQMELRDHETRQVETQIEVRFRDLEKRWMEERSSLVQSLKNKEDEALELRQAISRIEGEARSAKEEALKAVDQERKALAYEFEIKKDELLREKDAYSARLEQRERELVALKAQLAMIDSQVRMAHESSQKTIAEKERHWNLQISDIDRDFAQLKQARDQMEEQFKRAEADKQALSSQLRDAQNAIHSLEQKTAAMEQLQSQIIRADAEGKALSQKLTESEIRIRQYEEKLKYFDQVQAGIARIASENEALRQELHESKNRLDAHIQKINDLRMEHMRKSDEKDAIEREFFSERQSWSGKIEERVLIERNLQETLNARDLELSNLKIAMATLESRLKSQFDIERKQVGDMQQQMLRQKEEEMLALRVDIGDKLVERERELADLKLEYTSMRAELYQQFEKEKAALVEMHKQQFQQELTMRADSMQKELDEAQASVVQNFAELDRKLKAEEARHQKEIHEKEIQLVKTLEMVRSLEEEIMQERQERFQQKTDFEARVAQETARMNESLEALKESYRGEKERQDLQAQLDAQANARAEAQSLSLGQKIWKYLSRTVIIVNFRGVPRKSPNGNP